MRSDRNADCSRPDRFNPRFKAREAMVLAVNCHVSPGALNGTRSSGRNSSCLSENIATCSIFVYIVLKSLWHRCLHGMP